MAVVHEVVVEHTGESVLQAMRVSWGGIVSGVLVVLGTLILLTALGIAVGITAANPTESDASSFGVGAAIWSGISLLVALFFGGLASTRLGMVWDKTTGVVQGGLVWVLAMLLMLYLAASGVAVVVGGALGIAQSAAETAGGAIAGGQDLASIGSGSPDEIVQRLRDPGTASSIASVTGMQETEVRQTLEDVAIKVEASRENPEQAAAEVRAGTAQLLERAQQQLAATAQEVKPEATAGAWISFFGLLLSLAAAVIGAAVGRRKAVDRVVQPEAVAR